MKNTWLKENKAKKERKGTIKQVNIKKANIKKIAINQIISIITLNINRIKAQIKRQILSVCIISTRTIRKLKQLCSLQGTCPTVRTWLKVPNHREIESKTRKEINNANVNRKSIITTLLSK